MELALEQMLDIITAPAHDPGIENVPHAAYDHIMAAVAAIEPPPPIRALPENAFNEASNILSDEIRNLFKTEQVFAPTNIFSAPTSTTCTMGGFISKVEFHEQELIRELMTDHRIVICKCNFGRVKYDYYTEPVKIKTSNRGRKKKPKVRKNRKNQGNGTDFNSQMTFIMTDPATVFGEAPDGSVTVPYGATVYKFKVFRTGQIQLPGVKQSSADAIVECVQRIVQVLNFHLHPGVFDTSLISHAININPVMQNYKFSIVLPPKHIIDLTKLNMVIAKIKAAHNERIINGENDHSPQILDSYFSRQETKLSVIFSTPVYRRDDKKTRFNIFMRGKTNILGGLDSAQTRIACTYLHTIIEANYADIVVPEFVGNVPARQRRRIAGK